jgi:hypothetical protein
MLVTRGCFWAAKLGGMSERLYLLLPAAAVLLAACSSAPPPAPRATLEPEPDPAPARPAPQGVAASAELGSLDERGAEQSFRDSLDGFDACIRNGVERLEFIGGSIEFAVKVDSSRHAMQVWAAESTLGDRGTEKCMFDVLRSVSWPAPEGGPVGIARNAFEFKPRRGTITPAVWDAGRISRTLAKLDGRINECRGDGSPQLLITLYIGDGGKALGGGAASAEPADEGTVDCVVEALLAADYPSPERTPTKVRFQL